MKKTALALFIVFGLVNLNTLQAQTSVYFCQQTDTFGYSSGSTHTSDIAFERCINLGGNSPAPVYFTSKKGYGAIAEGTTKSGKKVIGIVAGNQNLSNAIIMAEKECRERGGQKISVKNWWKDEAKSF
ncbi:MAG: DUF4189 domain-containing protein [Ichthyobacteriaceae bacterium]|nr:DUF4189 domain-containing protein [Ichthyobacteriaceae bacterium]